MLTRANIAYNLYKTPHHLTVNYNGQEVIYHFSSELYRLKFMSRHGEQRQIITESLAKRFGFTIQSDLIADLRTYSSIEKRGFLISVDGEYKECLNDMELNGLKILTRNFQEQ